jgi:hypothetical protein
MGSEDIFLVSRPVIEVVGERGQLHRQHHLSSCGGGEGERGRKEGRGREEKMSGAGEERRRREDRRGGRDGSTGAVRGKERQEKRSSTGGKEQR